MVQVMPSGLVMTRLPVSGAGYGDEQSAPYVTPYQLLSAAEVRLVQVMPSELVMTRFPVAAVGDGDEDAVAVRHRVPFVIVSRGPAGPVDPAGLAIAWEAAAITIAASSASSDTPPTSNREEPLP